MNMLEEFCNALKDVFFSDRVYVLREIVEEPKTIRQIAEDLKMPYVTVRKYLTWAKSKAVATVVGTKKEGSKLAELWLLTFIPEVIELKEENMLIKAKVRIYFRKVFCERFCPFKNTCRYYKENTLRRPYIVVEIEKKFVKLLKGNQCK